MRENKQSRGIQEMTAKVDKQLRALDQPPTGGDQESATVVAMTLRNDPPAIGAQHWTLLLVAAGMFMTFCGLNIDDLGLWVLITLGVTTILAIAGVMTFGWSTRNALRDHITAAIIEQREHTSSTSATTSTLASS